MTKQVPVPLPECPGCDRPVRRAVYDANGGLCSDCRTDVEYGRYRTLPLVTARAHRAAR